MCEKPIVSVIVPVYNVEVCLESCVNSILSQTFQKFELILIDDGSSDGSGVICDCLKKNDKRIRVIHKENAGLAHTRNIGTQNARGEYITFVDSDDVISNKYLELLWMTIQKYDADMSTCEFFFCEEGSTVKFFIDGEYDEGVLTGYEALRRMLIGELHGGSACGLFIRKSLALKYPFPVGKYHEDDMTTYKFFTNAKRVAYVRAPLYIYYQRFGSIMHRDFCIIDIDELDAADMIFEDCKKIGKEYEEAALVKKMNNYLQVSMKLNNSKKKDFRVCKRINSFFRLNLLSLLLNKYIGKKNKLKIMMHLVDIFVFRKGRCSF
ncbi:glycosyltransferase [Selenomonas caprae]|uniref:Glycosyltransferase n=1 Tax=Selenomonas caprae TaxID=2606905 RepID=A0A5D6WRS6_9FIRM|nr:glycosyltransferase [Selenomonas caprae]TYZ29819.1 glycosyltransferase [Selenomonas caprae]